MSWLPCILYLGHVENTRLAQANMVEIAVFQTQFLVLQHVKDHAGGISSDEDNQSRYALLEHVCGGQKTHHQMALRMEIEEMAGMHQHMMLAK